MWERTIGILKVNHFGEADLRNESIVEKEVRCGRNGKQDERSPKEENGA